VINYLEYITEYGLSLRNFITIILLVLPNLLLITVPLSLFLSVIFTYNKLIKNNEIIILQSVGVKKPHLIEPVAYFNVIVALLLYLNTMFFIPKTNRQSDNMKEVMKNDLINLMFKNNRFDNIKNITFYANTNSQQELENLMLYIKSTDSKEKDKMIYSKTAEINGVYITLHDGNIQEFSPLNREENSIIFFEKYNLNFGDYYNIDAKDNSAADMDALNIFELFNLKNNKKVASEIVKRMISPTIGLFLSVLASCLILNKKFSRMESEIETARIYLLCTLLFMVFTYLLKGNADHNLLLLYVSLLLIFNLILIRKRDVL
jgi:lipopolysaccharide export LptBFGC system permease protein LptF